MSLSVCNCGHMLQRNQKYAKALKKCTQTHQFCTHFSGGFASVIYRTNEIYCNKYRKCLRRNLFHTLSNNEDNDKNGKSIEFIEQLMK